MDEDPLVEEDTEGEEDLLKVDVLWGIVIIRVLQVTRQHSVVSHVRTFGRSMIQDLPIYNPYR